MIYFKSGKFFFALIAFVACMLFAILVSDPLYKLIGLALGIAVTFLYVITEAVVESAYIKYTEDERKRITRSNN